MLIVHIISNLNIGGAELMLYRLVTSPIFVSNDVQHVVISLKDEGEVGKILKAQGVFVHTLNLKNKFLFIQYFFRLFRLIRILKPQVVQTWMVHSDLIGGLAARLAGVKNVIWGVRTTDYSVESFLTRIVRWCCANLSGVVPCRIVCAAQASLNNSRTAGYNLSKLMVIGNGFDVDKLNKFSGFGLSIKEELGLTAEADILIVGCLGRFNAAKDHANFVRAAGLIATANRKIYFLMVGKDLDEDNKKLMNLIVDTGFKDRFILLGERDDPAACLDAMDVFVLSSSTEGFPNVLGEAMSMGVPCITTNVGDASVLMDGLEWVVPPRDSVALALKIQKLLTLSADERHYLGALGRERIIKKFSISETALQFLSLYKSL